MRASLYYCHNIRKTVWDNYVLFVENVAHFTATWTCSINYKNTYKKGTRLSFRQVLEKNYLVANNLPTSSFGWTLYQVASNPNTIHRIKMNIKNVLKCKFGIFTCPSSWIYIVLFTFFICERQDTALPLHFDSSPFLKNRGYTHPAPFEAAQNNLPKGFPALFEGRPHSVRPSLPDSSKEPHCRIAPLQ